MEEKAVFYAIHIWHKIFELYLERVLFFNNKTLVLLSLVGKLSFVPINLATSFPVRGKRKWLEFEMQARLVRKKK